MDVNRSLFARGDLDFISELFVSGMAGGQNVGSCFDLRDAKNTLVIRGGTGCRSRSALIQTGDLNSR